MEALKNSRAGYGSEFINLLIPYLRPWPFGAAASSFEMSEDGELTTIRSQLVTDCYRFGKVNPLQIVTGLWGYLVIGGERKGTCCALNSRIFFCQQG